MPAPPPCDRALPSGGPGTLASRRPRARARSKSPANLVAVVAEATARALGTSRRGGSSSSGGGLSRRLGARGVTCARGTARSARSAARPRGHHSRHQRAVDGQPIQLAPRGGSQWQRQSCRVAAVAAIVAVSPSCGTAHGDVLQQAADTATGRESGKEAAEKLGARVTSLHDAEESGAARCEGCAAAEEYEQVSEQAREAAESAADVVRSRAAASSTRPLRGQARPASHARCGGRAS